MNATGGAFDPTSPPIYFRATSPTPTKVQYEPCADWLPEHPMTGGAYDPADRPMLFRAQKPRDYTTAVTATGGGAFDPDVAPIYFRASQGRHNPSRMGPGEMTPTPTGGAFDPERRNLYFTASDAKTQDVGHRHHTCVLVAVNELATAGNEKYLETWLDNGATVFLDSGIFNLTNEHMRSHAGMTMDQALALPPEEIDGFDELFARYVELVRRYGDRLWGYIELDQGGKDNKRKTRARLEDMGMHPVPVYHPFNDGWDYFDELAENYDRMCFGNVVQADRVQRKRLVATAWERHRRYPNLWIHLLGLTPNEWLMALPVDSADSSAWLSSVRWSGYKETAALRTLGPLPREFQYELASNAEGDTGSKKAVAMSAIGCKAMQRNWRTHLAALEQHLGLPLYPEPVAAEGRLHG